MKVKELVAQLLELPQDDDIVITSMDDDFMCHEFEIHSPYEENTQAQEIILPYYFNDYDEEPIDDNEDDDNFHCMSISEKDYENTFKKLENLTGEECYNKYGLKRGEGCYDEYVINCNYRMTLKQEIPDNPTETTYAMATLWVRETDQYIDSEDTSDSVVGQWEFCLDDDTTLTVDVGLHEDFE